MWKNGGPIQDYSGPAELMVTGAPGPQGPLSSPPEPFSHIPLSQCPSSPFSLQKNLMKRMVRKQRSWKYQRPEWKLSKTPRRDDSEVKTRARERVGIQRSTHRHQLTPNKAQSVPGEQTVEESLKAVFIPWH